MEDVYEEPLFVQRVAGLDIAKAEVEVSIRVPSDTSSGAAPRWAWLAGVSAVPGTGDPGAGLLHHRPAQRR